MATRKVGLGSKSFAAAVKAWGDKVEEKMTMVFREAATDLIETANEVGPSKANPGSTGTGNMPVDTGFLRNSVQVVLNGPLPPANRKRPEKGGAVAYSPDFELAIVGAVLGDTISAGWTANYAVHVEYGTSKMAPRQFVGKAVQKWGAIVDRAVARHRD